MQLEVAGMSVVLPENCRSPRAAVLGLDVSKLLLCSIDGAADGDAPCTKMALHARELHCMLGRGNQSSWRTAPCGLRTSVLDVSSIDGDITLGTTDGTTLLTVTMSLAITIQARTI